jgi:hypothetical protein
MPALVAGIHDLLVWPTDKDVDGRDKPGHDENHPSSSARFRLAIIEMRIR